MVQSGAIRAGRAFVELFADDTKLVRGLRAAQRRLRGFQSFVNGLGRKLLAGAAVVATALGAMVKKFASVGDQFDKIAARTGVSVEMLSKLGFAAEQSGADVKTLERGLGDLGRFIVDLETGSKSAADMMGILGLSMDALKGKSPDERVKILLNALAGIEDPSLRAGVAMKVLGRAGRQLLPMAGNFDALAAQAEKLGIVLSTEDATAAAALTDALNLLKHVLKTVLIQIGAALAGDVTKAASKIAEIVSQAISWVKSNRELIATVAKIVGIVAAAGAGLIALGIAAGALNAIIGLGITLWTGIGAAISLVGTLIAALMSPIGLVIAGIAALSAFFIDWGGIASDTLTRAGDEFHGFKERAISAWGGIRDAIAAGDLKLAFKIVVLALKAEWIRIVNAIKAKWNEWIGFFQSIWTNAVFGAARIMTNAWAGLQKFWWNLTDTLADAWSIFTGFIQKTWNKTVGFLKKAWGKLKSMVTGKKGRSSADIDRETSRLNAEVDRKRDAAIMRRERERKQGLAAIERNRKGTIDALNEELERREQARRDSEQSEIEENEAKLNEAKRELAKAIEEAKKKREAKEAEDEKARNKNKPGEIPRNLAAANLNIAAKQQAKSEIEGTTSAFDRFAGTSSDPGDRDRKKMIEKLDKIEAHTRKTSRSGGRTVPLS